ncbi:MAG TPA: PadR family transcriptional regulator [Mycobacteriales bacterium]|nr:PadR family transcriptional regulator [Mycobacteriales bacterium]
MTDTTERVLRVLLEDPTAPWYGYELMKAAKVQSGTLYPMLARLAEDGLVESEWEPEGERPGGRPPRKFYTLTGVGVATVRQELAEHDAARHAGTPARVGRGTGALRPARGGSR